MKKLLAIILALTLLTTFTLTALAEAAATPTEEAAADEPTEAAAADAPAEEAEPTEAAPAAPAVDPNAPAALMLRADGITANYTTNDGSQSLALDDFSLLLALDTTENLRLIAAAFQGDARLALAAMQLSGDRLQIAFDGVEKTYESAIPQLADADTSALPQLVRAMLPGLLGAQLPLIPAPTLTKLNLPSLIPDYITETAVEGGTTTSTFAVSETAVALFIEQLSTAMKNSAQRASLKQYTDILDDYPNSDLAFSLGGTITDTDATEACEIKVFISAGGELADLPTAILRIESALNTFKMALSLPTETDEYTIGNLYLGSNPAANTLELSFDALSALNGSLVLSQEAELQTIALDYSAGFLNQLIDVDVIYGQTGGMGLTSVMAQSRAGRFEYTTSGMPTGSDSYAGTIDISSNTQTSALNVSGAFTQTLGALDLTYEMPADIVPMERLTAEEVSFALQPLGEYFSGLMPSSEAEAEAETAVQSE